MEQGYDALCRSLVQSIRTESEARDTLRGTYALIVARRPEIPPKGTKPWIELVATSVQTIQAMSKSSSAAETSLLRTKAGHLSLAKGSCAGNTIGLLRASEAKWEGEVRDELSQLLQEAIDKKRVKIEKKGVPGICSGVLLLLYDAYAFSDVEDARQALETVHGYEWFHSIFWAASFSDRQNALYPNSPGRSGVFLFSKNGAWR